MPSSLPQSQHQLLGSVPLLNLRIFGLCFLIETVYALLLLTLISSSLGEQYALGSLAFLWATHTLKFIFEIWMVLRLVSKAFATRYFLAEGKLTIYSGVFNQEEHVYELAQLKNILLVQSWLGRHLKYGDLCLTLSSSGYKEVVTLTGLNDPRKYERFLREEYLGG